MRERYKLFVNVVKRRLPCRYLIRGFGHNLSPPWKIMFFGTDEFALESLKMLHHEMTTTRLVQELRVVCAQFKCPVAKFSMKHNLPLLQWKPSVEEIIKTEAQIGFVASFGHLIPSKIISAFPLGMLNAHASILPRWRGAAPIVHAVLNQDKVTGVSVMKIQPHRFDEGEILSSAACEIGPDDSALLLTQRLAVLAAAELRKSLVGLPKCLDLAKPQPKTGVTLAPKITPSMSACNWSTRTSREISAQHLALSHLHPLYATWQNQPIKLLDCVQSGKSSGSPGDVTFDWQHRRLLVACRGKSSVGIRQVKLPGKPTISAIDFLNGYLKKLNKNLWKFGPGLES